MSSATRFGSPLLAAALAGLVGQGCAPLVVGGAAVGAVAVTQDRRSAGVQIDDKTIELKVYEQVRRDPRLTVQEGPEVLDPTGTEREELSHVVATAYNGALLLTGEVPSEAARADLVARARAIDKVRVVHDELQVAPPSSADSRNNDVLVGGQVASRMLLEKDFDSDAVKTTTTGGTVYLMGLVSQREAEMATEIARTTSGVRRVVKLFEYLD